MTQSREPCQDNSFSKVHTRANCCLCLNNTDCLSIFPLFSCTYHLPWS